MIKTAFLTTVTFLAAAFLAQAEAQTTPTVFLLDDESHTPLLHMEFQSAHASIGPTRQNEANKDFRTVLTPHTSETANARFAFWPVNTGSNRCVFKATFAPDTTAIVTAENQGKARCWVAQIAPHFYVLHTAF